MIRQQIIGKTIKARLIELEKARDLITWYHTPNWGIY